MSGVTLAECGCDNNGLQVSSVNYRFPRQQILTHLQMYLPESVNVEFSEKKWFTNLVAMPSSSLWTSEK